MFAYVFIQLQNIYNKEKYNLLEVWSKYIYGEQQSFMMKTFRTGIKYALGTYHQNKTEFVFLSFDYFELYVWFSTIFFVLSVLIRDLYRIFSR